MPIPSNFLSLPITTKKIRLTLSIFLFILFNFSSYAATYGDFEYTDDGESVTITDYNGSATELEVPSEINNLPVKIIGASAFRECKSLTSITIPDIVTSIGDSAFSYCSGLNELTIPDSVTRIGYMSFHGCSGLTKVSISPNLTYISDAAFENCTGLTEITIPNGITSIGFWAFQGCSNLSEITIPGNVNSIGFKAFYGCSKLTSITIPASVRSIEKLAFSNCSNLESIETAELNQYYGTLNGILFNKNKSKLVCYPMGKTFQTYHIPDSVNSIGEWAFHSCKNLTELFIPDSVTSIERYAMEDCSILKSIVFSKNLTSFPSSILSGCENLEMLYFYADQPLLTGSNNNEEILSGTVYYLPGTNGWGETFLDRVTAPLPEYKINIEVDSTRGNFAGPLEQNIHYYLPSKEVVITAKPGYKFLRWEGDYNSEEPNLIIPHVTSDMTVRAVFALQDGYENEGLPEGWKTALVNANLDDGIESFDQVTEDGDLDGDGLTNRQEYELGTNPLVLNQLLIEPQWNLIHIPKTLNPDDSSIDDLFPDRLGKLWSWDHSGGYVDSEALGDEENEISAGDGFWMYWNAEPTAITISGTEIATMELNLSEGWNLIGTIYPMEIPAELKNCEIWYWDAQNQVYAKPQNNRLLPGIGYWVKPSQATTITMKR